MRRLPIPDGDSDAGSGGWVRQAIPDAVALRALSVAVRGPETVTVGEPARFVVSVRNRLPVGIEVTLPSSRLWGWRVDGVPEADERGYRPPDATRTATFGGGERRDFTATWDGRIRHDDGGGDRWDPDAGTVTFTGYLAVENWERRGLCDRTDVAVVADS